MWTGGRRTKTNLKTSPEQSDFFQLIREINKTNCSITRKTAPDPGSHFHDDWAKNVTSRVHVIQLTGTIFELNSHIKETNVLTKFHENWAKNVTSRVFTCFHYIHIEKNAPPTGSHGFSPIWTIFQLVQDINKTNVLTNFHDDWAKIVTSRVFTRKNAPPPGGHVFQPTAIFELDRDFIGTKLLTKFHEDRTINVASRVFTNKFSAIIKVILMVSLPPLAHLRFKETDLFCSAQDVNIHEEWTINVISRVLTRINSRSSTGTIFKHIQDIIRRNVLTKFHEDRAINATFRVLKINQLTESTKLRPLASKPAEYGGKLGKTRGIHFSLKLPHFSLSRAEGEVTSPKNWNIIGKNLLTKFHEDWTITVASRVLTRKNALSSAGTIYRLVQDIIGKNLLTKFHDDRTINVVSRVFTSHVFQAMITIFKLVQDIIVINLLTKFHEERTINVASWVLTRKNKMRFKSYCKMLKLAQTNQPTDQPTDQQTGQKQYVPHYYSGGHKKLPPGSHVFQPTGTIFIKDQYTLCLDDEEIES
ncbi:hypothetical protein DPMN_000825 [Dreissena polymorpha]|uniref:Uncharacterized protein n=1 Tax=Dreissena polymorpha TaxID=45954 RepID=A0A9D4MKH7_DREPO|nr:hypothetical protein DPMN_000825 [Dreissena polymorpha]